MNSSEKTHFLFNMESSPRGIKASRKGVWWCSPFIWTESSDWSLTKRDGNGFFLSMLSSKHFQTNSSGVPSLCVTAKRILSLCSICCLSRFIFLRSPSCNFTQVDCLECMASGSNCCIPLVGLQRSLRSFLLPSPKLRWHPRTSGSYYFTGGKLHFGEQLFDFKTEGAVKNMWKNPTFPPIVRIIWELLLW